MRLVTRLIVVFLLIVISVVAYVPAVAAPEPVPADLGALARRAVDLANQERVKAGLNPLRWNDQLAASANVYAREMATKTFFSHTGQDGSTPTERARRAQYPAYGWGGLYVGENLARGYNSAESVHQAWMASEGHRQNLLLPKYREIGIGLAVAADGTLYWAQEFGSHPNYLPIFINDDSRSTDSTSVKLTLTDEQVSPWGSLGAIAGMMVSNRPDFIGAAWEPFSASKSWKLQARPGTQTVYAKLVDATGQVVESTADIQYVGRVALALDEPEAIADSVAEAESPLDAGAMALGAAPQDEPTESSE